MISSYENIAPQVYAGGEIVYGAFAGMGDLLCAGPVIAHELRRGTRVHLILLPSRGLLEFTKLIDFGANDLLTPHVLPAGVSPALWMEFFHQMRSLDPHHIWVSPHAPQEVSSWKIPILFRLLKSLFWSKGRVVGATTERGALALNDAIEIDRTLPYARREWEAYRKAFHGLPEDSQPIAFVPEIMQICNLSSQFDLVIHPGATAASRKWAVENYVKLLQILPSSLRICVVGVPQDIADVKAVMHAGRDIEYRSGSLKDALKTIASTRLLLSMDSGTVHFAGVLKVPVVALFGKTDPAKVVESREGLFPIYRKVVPCQPCGSVECTQSRLFCMEAITAEMVAREVLVRLSQIEKQVP
ncbi:MAG: hypothetical protein JSS87_01335 [Acidobacteria bacterium]|nr:hypothetical protein [Acidobacteriota bacterium]